MHTHTQHSLPQESVESRVLRRQQKEKESKHMEAEMQEAMQSMKERQAMAEASVKKQQGQNRIDTPGARREPGTPRYTPKRFGM